MNGAPIYFSYSVQPYLAINENAPTATPVLRSRHYDGYWSVLRHNFNTPNEHVVFFQNGNWYYDHKVITFFNRICCAPIPTFSVRESFVCC
jgi:hypothetical protein